MGGIGAFALIGSLHAQTQFPINFASTIGNTSTQTADYQITPSAGTVQYLATTINPVASVPPNLGATAADTNVARVNDYFGLPNGTLAGLGAQDGSGFLSQQVTLTIGTVVSFDYIFLTDEDNTTTFNNDLAFFTVNGALNRTIYRASMFTDVSNSPNFDLQSVGALTSGYAQMTYTVPSTGDYTFGFGVADVATNTVYSGLLIDNFYSSIPAPEPGTSALLVGAAAALGLMLLRRRAAGSAR